METEDVDPLLNSIDRAARRLSISTREIYAAMQRGDLDYVKVGRRRLIPEDEIRRFARIGTAA